MAKKNPKSFSLPVTVMPGMFFRIGNSQELEFFKNELKINLPLEQSITDISQAPEGEKNFKKIVKYAEVTEINLERDKIYLCGFYTKNNFLAHCGIVIDKKILHINKNGAVMQSIGTIKRIYSLWSLKFYEITRDSCTST